MEASLGKKLGVYTIAWFNIAIVYGVIAFIVGMILLDNQVVNLPVLLVFMVIGYYAISFGFRYANPRIHLYEGGVHVIENNKQSTWTWEQLTHFKGKRKTHRVILIPVYRSGYNDFYADKKFAFRVGGIVGDANSLVYYCLARMAQVRIPAIVKDIHQGKFYQVDSLKIEKRVYSGVMTKYPHMNKPFEYPYSMIEQHRFTYDSMAESYKFQIKLNDEKKFREVAEFIPAGGFYVMGIVDALQGKDCLQNAILDTIVPMRRIKRLVLYLAVPTLIIVSFLAVVFLLAWLNQIYHFIS